MQVRDSPCLSEGMEEVKVVVVVGEEVPKMFLGSRRGTRRLESRQGAH